ncbi:TonB-dependent receptor plug domain-containing protein [Sphingomonas sp. ID0503]|uniref:TonB-dependent receptor plug domain-containing protein n=1 Tax=Sphingomonas sp. ID0503 TaxID=3399691 RepID=UPI003AFA67F2
MISHAALAVALLGSAAASSAQTTPESPREAGPAPQAEDGASASEIVVLGTRRLDRSLTDSASPVDVISAQELTTQPAADMLDVVRNIVPSFSVGQNTISDASTFVRSPTLRGLPADQILVMINGKRFNRSALVQVAGGGDTALSIGSQGADISLIPSIAIGNLQVLREGATAQYGSDAIAGVLNYSLRTDPHFEATARYGQFYDNGGDGESKQFAASVGLPVGDAGFITFAGEYFDDNGTSRGVTRPLAALLAENNPGLADQIPNYPGPAQIWGSSPTDGYKLMFNTGFDVADYAQIYFFGNLAHSKADQSFNYRPPISGTFVDEGGVSHSLGMNGAFAHPVYLTPCPPGSVTCAAGGFIKDSNVFNFSSLYPAGFTPRFVGVKDQAYGVLGVKGEVSDLRYDLSASLARNSLDLSMYQSLNASYGPLSQTEFKFGKLIQKEFNANADFTYEVDAGLASPITIAFGGEFRRESYTSTAGDEQSYGIGPYSTQPLYVETAPGVFVLDSTVSMSPGASGYGGTSPNSAGTTTQKSWGGYLSVEADVTDTLTLGAAGRYEHYNTFGSAKVGKINALWKATPGVSVRGTVGTGFHAPSPGQAATEILTTSFSAGVQVQTGTYPVDSPIAQYFGAVGLKPEKSTNYGLGLVLEPMTDFTVTIDAYQIKVRNRISITSSFGVTAADLIAQPALAAVGEGGDVNYFTNGFDTRTRGVDVVANYKINALDNPLNLTIAYNYNKNKVTSHNPVAINDARIYDISHYSPRHRLNASGVYSIGDFTLTVRENFYSSWSTEQDYPGDKFGSEFTTDIDVSYTLSDHYTLSVGATNLFNNYPDKIKNTVDNPIYPITGGTADGQVYPRSGGPFGMNGGFWYGRVRVKF